MKSTRVRGDDKVDEENYDKINSIISKHTTDSTGVARFCVEGPENRADFETSSGEGNGEGVSPPQPTRGSGGAS